MHIKISNALKERSSGVKDFGIKSLWLTTTSERESEGSDAHREENKPHGDQTYISNDMSQHNYYIPVHQFLSDLPFSPENCWKEEPILNSYIYVTSLINCGENCTN
jgi:hypothetical protein